MLANIIIIALIIAYSCWVIRYSFRVKKSGGCVGCGGIGGGCSGHCSGCSACDASHRHGFLRRRR